MKNRREPRMDRRSVRHNADVISGRQAEDLARACCLSTHSQSDFDSSVERYNRVLTENLDVAFRVARRCGVVSSHVDDVLQDVFLIVATKLPQIAPASQRTFVVSVAIRVAANWRRGQQRRAEEPITHADELVGLDPGPERHAERGEGLRLLEMALVHMTPEQREVFIMAELEQCTCNEIASVLGLQEAAVVSRLRRARENFDQFCQALRSDSPSVTQLGRVKHV